MTSKTDAIKALKYRYLRCVDLRLWDELAQTLAAEVTASYGKRLSYTGRDEVVAGLQKQMTDGVITEHQAHHPKIEIDGDTATAEDAQEVCGAIREALRADYGDATADATRILYGGSAKPGNIKELMAQPDVDGALVGGASLKADSFAAMAGFYA